MHGVHAALDTGAVSRQFFLADWVVVGMAGSLGVVTCKPTSVPTFLSTLSNYLGP